MASNRTRCDDTRNPAVAASVPLIEPSPYWLHMQLAAVLTAWSVIVFGIACMI